MPKLIINTFFVKVLKSQKKYITGIRGGVGIVEYQGVFVPLV
jgi:hypothetical protein